ncbi:clavesin-2 [Aphomia sociella]
MSAVQFSVEKEYEILPHIKSADVEIIRNWLITQPHLPHKYITDLEIVLAYHCCECNMELTKQVIDLNYTLRTLFSFYSNREINKSLEVALHTWLITPLISPTIDGYRAVYCQLLDDDATKSVYSDLVRAFVMIIDLWQYEEGTVPGIVIIVNMERVTLNHITSIDLTVAQEFFYFLQEAMFIRLKEFHFINAPSFMDKMLTMMKPILKKEMLDLLKVHHVGSNTLEKYIPIETLPKEAGGGNLILEELRDNIWNKLKSNQSFFDEESKKRVDESKRSGQPKTISTIFPGLEGSFKNLAID